MTPEAIAKEICAPELREIAAELIKLAYKPEVKRDALYTYREVAMLTGVHYDTIFRSVQAGRLKADYIGSEPRIQGAAIFQWLEDGGETGRSRRDLMREAA